MTSKKSVVTTFLPGRTVLSLMKSMSSNAEWSASLGQWIAEATKAAGAPLQGGKLTNLSELTLSSSVSEPSSAVFVLSHVCTNELSLVRAAALLGGSPAAPLACRQLGPTFLPTGPFMRKKNDVGRIVRLVQTHAGF